MESKTEEPFVFFEDEGVLQTSNIFLKKDEWLMEFLEKLKDFFEDVFFLIITNDSQPIIDDPPDLKLVFYFKHESEEEATIHEPLTAILLSEIDRNKPMKLSAEFIAKTIFSFLKEKREVRMQEMFTEYRLFGEIRQRVVDKMPWIKL
jgi:hypothetical protein